jgi:pimeloyl-ACP methyl ester carboxylesterase
MMRPRSKWFGWERDLIAVLTNGSTVMQTPAGSIEYACEGNGPTIVGVHGAPGGYDQAIFLLKEISSHGFQTLGWSRPGYLRTPLDVGKSVEAQADALAQLLDALAINRIAIYGVSAGGPTALMFALRHPDRVWAIIMECAISQKYVAHPDSLVKKLFTKLMFNNFGMWLWDLLAKYTPKSTVRQLISMESLLGPKQTSELLDHIMEKPEKVQYVMRLIESFCPISLRKMGFNNDVEQCTNLTLPLNAICCPTLVIHGTADAEVPIQHGEFTAANIPRAEFYRVENGFHILRLSDQADQILTTKINFLKKHAPTRL